MPLAARIVLGVVVTLAVGSPTAGAATPPGGVCLTTPLQDLRGVIHELVQNDHAATRVFVFLSTECPVSNSYIPTLNRLRDEADNESVDLYGVVTDPTVTRSGAAAHFGEFKLTIPVLFDPAGHLAALLQPTHVPEAFVLDASDRVVYRGAKRPTTRCCSASSCSLPRRPRT